MNNNIVERARPLDMAKKTSFIFLSNSKSLYSKCLIGMSSSLKRLMPFVW